MSRVSTPWSQVKVWVRVLAVLMSPVSAAWAQGQPPTARSESQWGVGLAAGRYEPGIGYEDDDVNEIGILIRNLVDNALRYTFIGGTVRISCGYREGSGISEAVLEIADDGPGVPAAEQSIIFERFHRATASNAVRGSGIGLSLVARIATMHSARIETGAGMGSPGLSIRVSFPLAAAKP